MGSQKIGGTRMKKVMVLMGGISSEREISLLSGTNVANALTSVGYHVIPHDLTTNINALIDVLHSEKPDVVFNALHGKYGEDGCVQGLLNMLQIPYTHSGVLASSVGMDKDMTRHIVSQNGVSVPKGSLMTKADFLAHEPIKPYVIKPNDEGSSVGVFIVLSDEDKEKALAHWSSNKKMLIEDYIAGQELSVAVLDGKALGVVEIVPKTGYYDFQNKYTDGATTHIIPAPIAPALYQEALKQAEKAHQAIGCRGVSRSDFRLNKTDLRFLEINTNPGMTKLSLVPEIARTCANMTYEQLVSHLVEEASCDT